MIEAILSFKGLIQLSVEQMRHFKQAARLYLFHKEPHCTDACIQRLTLHPFILCSSQ